MNPFIPKSPSLRFQLEINKIRENDEALKIEVAEINRIAKELKISPKYVRLNEKIHTS
jgi:hypothetical protein